MTEIGEEAPPTARRAWPRLAGLALAGTVIGAKLGEQADEKERREAQARAQYALEHYPSGQTAQWGNPQGGNYGTVTPQPGYVEGGQYCRPYTQTITVDGETRVIEGTACRQADGTWYIIDTGS